MRWWFGSGIDYLDGGVRGEIGGFPRGTDGWGGKITPCPWLQPPITTLLRGLPSLGGGGPAQEVLLKAWEAICCIPGPQKAFWAASPTLRTPLREAAGTGAAPLGEGRPSCRCGSM